MAHQWKDHSDLRVSRVSWELLRRTFHDRFFPREKRYEKVEDLIKLCQGGMIVQEYSLKFIKFSKYASLLMSNPIY